MGLAFLSACAALVLAAVAGHPRAQDALADAVASELRAGRYAEALRRAGEASEPALAARLEADVRWAAGDLDGALAAAQEGLTAVPGDPLLASTAADLALTLGLAEEARRHLVALDGALAQEAWSSSASEETRRWWQARRAGLEALALGAEADLAARDRALSRARTVGGGFLALASAAFVALLLAPGRRLPQRG
jgi:hypothetical protein